MSAEYVDSTPIGEGGSIPVTLDLPETQATDDAASLSEDKSTEVQGEQAAAQGEQGEQPTAEAAAAKDEEAQHAEVETKTPEEKASYWRGEHFKVKQSLEGQITELQEKLTEASATPAFLKLDVPPSEWNPAEQIRDIPPAYQDKLLSHGFWETLPNVVNNIGEQPQNVKDALYDTFDRVIQGKTGLSIGQVIDWAAAYAGGEPAQPQANQPQTDLVQELADKGYTDVDPEMKAAKWAAAQEGRLRQLEAAHKTSASQQEALAKQQEAANRAQAEAAFESKKSAVWNNALKTFEGKVPQGKEFMLDFIRDRAEKMVGSDQIASGYLNKVQGFLMAATNPMEREQYEKLASGSLAAYNAKVAVAIQSAAKQILGEIAEKEHLRSTVAATQMQRRDITPGQSSAPSGSREEIMKTPIGGNSDVAAEMAVAMYRARHPS